MPRKQSIVSPFQAVLWLLPFPISLWPHLQTQKCSQPWGSLQHEKHCEGWHGASWTPKEAVTTGSKSRLAPVPLHTVAIQAIVLLPSSHPLKVAEIKALMTLANHWSRTTSQPILIHGPYLGCRSSINSSWSPLPTVFLSGLYFIEYKSVSTPICGHFYKWQLLNQKLFLGKSISWTSTC